MKMPQVRLVFDRKNTATSSRVHNPKSALVQVEILHERRRKYISTGVRVYKDQWSDSVHVRNRIDSCELNNILNSQIVSISSSISDIVSENGMFSFDMLYAAERKKNDQKQTFVEFMESRIMERGDIEESTRAKHLGVLREVKNFGRFTRFEDLTPENAMLFNDYLHKKSVPTDSGCLSQVTIHTIQRRLKTYINMAVAMGYLQKSPYENIRISKGVGKGKKYLTNDELARLRECELTERLDKVRDVFLFQCYTALSYSDMAKFDFKHDAVLEGDRYKILDRRVKTDQDYYIVLMAPAMKILRKYDYRLPVISNQKMNEYLKLIAIAAKIDKPISTHYGRHTFCVSAFNNGISPDVIARMMGHKNSRVTLDAYARLVTKTVDEGYDKMEDIFS